MKQLTILAATALLALTACDKIPFLNGGNGSADAGNTANASNMAAAADAGVTSSRSLAGLSGGSESGATQGGGKDPTATQAASTEGVADPRLVGRWSDTGKCTDAAELRADGTFLAANGATGRWAVAGNQLIFSGPGGEFRLRIDSVEPNRIMTTTQEGQSGGSTRC